MLSQIQSETPPNNLAALAETHYFAANPPPKDLEKHVALAREFINYHSAAGRRLVLITSGGTTVPLGMDEFLFWIQLLRFAVNNQACRKADGSLH